MVKSRYKALQLVLAVGFGILFIVIPFIVFGNGAHPLRFKYLIFLVPLMGIFLLYSFFGRNPGVVFDSEFITAKYLFGTKVYRISLRDIEEVDIETPNKRSTGLRVMSKDFNSELFGAGTLRNINWEELLKDFKLIGIPARDDR